MKAETRDLIRRCRHPLEMKLFGIAALMALVVYAAVLGASLFHDELLGAAQTMAVERHRAEHPEAAQWPDAKVLEQVSGEDREIITMLEWLHWPVVLLAPAALVGWIAYSIGLMYGGARAQGVKVGPHQYPQAWAMWTEMSAKMGFDEPPELYVMNGNGTLNAFATCVPGWRAFSVVYSDLLERCLANNDMHSLRFILGHEMGHVRLNHVRWWYVLLSIPANLTGLNYFLGLPLSRSREYGCDKLGACMSGDQAHQGLLMLAAGKHLYRSVNFQQYVEDHVTTPSRWAALTNFFSGHPIISWRIRALIERRAGRLFYWGGTTPADPP